MNLIEAHFATREKAPKCCSYCDEEKKFLMVKPVAYSIDGEMSVVVNHTKSTLWTCLECFASDIDMLGHSVGVYEFEL